MIEKPAQRNLTETETRYLERDITAAVESVIERFREQLRTDVRMSGGEISFVVPVAMASGKWCAAITLKEELDTR